MEVTVLQFTWFAIIGVAIALYAILDGFDLGAGILYMFTTTEEERTTIRNSIGPIWDGNEVWLIAGGGGMLAAFPLAYATLFSSLYFAIMLLIWSLILRAVSFEFRTLIDYKVWKRIWDGAFVLGSFLPALLLGVAIGNVLNGMSLDISHNYTGTFFDLLNPFSLIVGLMVLFVFITQGATYLIARTHEGPFQERLNLFFSFSWIFYIILFFLVNISMLLDRTDLVANFKSNTILWIIPILSLIGIILIKYLNMQKQYLLSFAASSLTIVSLLISIGITIYPNIIPASNSAFSISISDAASSEVALGAMAVIAVISLPLILIYTLWIYKIFIFKKVSSDEMAYH